jgi:AraC-like DNA-binding protein
MGVSTPVYPILAGRDAPLRIRRGDVSLGRVATDLGFYDQSHFTRTFKRVIGLTPSQFAQRLDVR